MANVRHMGMGPCEPPVCLVPVTYQLMCHISITFKYGYIFISALCYFFLSHFLSIFCLVLQVHTLCTLICQQFYPLTHVSPHLYL